MPYYRENRDRHDNDTRRRERYSEVGLERTGTVYPGSLLQLFGQSLEKLDVDVDYYTGSYTDAEQCRQVEGPHGIEDVCAQVDTCQVVYDTEYSE